MNKKLLVWATCMLGATGSFAQMNGTYTVNAGAAASASNYTNVASAVSDLVSGTRADGGPVNGPGVSGNVVVRLAAGSGPYTEQITIGTIPGASAGATVRITGGPTMEEINFAGTTTTDRQVIKLNTASYVRLDSLSIVNNDASYGFGVHLMNSSDYNEITNCYVWINDASTSSNFAGIVIGGSSATTTGDHGEYNLFQNNLIHGGYYGISYNGINTTTYAQQNRVIGNTVEGFYYYGIRCYEQNQSEIRGNTIEARSNGTTSGYGIYNYYSDRFLITQNNINRFGTYGIYNYYANYQGGTPTSRAQLSNNFIGGNNIATTPYAIYVTTNARDIDIYHNSVSLTSGGGRCLYILSGTGANVVNNTFSYQNSTTGYAAYISSVSYINTMDYNNYYAPGSSNFVYVGSAFTPLDYVGGAGFNLNSINQNPGHNDINNDLHIGLYANLWDSGTDVGITEDYDGDTRPLAPTLLYDIGADEHTPDSVDVLVVSSEGLTNYMCPDSSVYVMAVFQNGGTNTLVNTQLTLSVSGAFTYLGTAGNGTGIVSGEVDTVWFGPINTYPGGTIDYQIYSAYPNDGDQENDTLSGSLYIQILPANPTPVADTVCMGGTGYLMAQNDGFTHAWYDGNGNLLGFADTLAVPGIVSDSTFYVENVTIIPNSLTTTYSNNNSCGGGNMFRVTALSGPVYIDSFDLNMSAGTTDVMLYYMVGDYTGNETNAAAWTAWDTISVTSAGTGAGTPCVPASSLFVPFGQVYSIYIYNTQTVYTSAAGDFSNSDILIEDGTGLCGQFSGTNYPRTWNGTLYYSGVSCPSAAVSAIVEAIEQPVADLGPDVTSCGAYDLDGTTSGATSYLWSTSETTPMITLNSGFSGDVVLEVSNAWCAADADTVNVVVNDVPVVNLGPDAGFCSGGNEVLNPQTSTSGAAYVWSTGATSASLTVNTAGTYWVSVTNPSTGCVGSDTVIVDEYALPVASFTSAIVSGTTYQFTDLSGGPATTWSWDFGDSGSSSVQNPQHTYAQAGTYTVTLIASNECGADTVAVQINVVGLDELSTVDMRMYPNPGSDVVYVSSSLEGTAYIRVMDMGGRTVHEAEAEMSGSVTQIADMRTWDNGTYIVIIAVNEHLFQSRMVKQ